MNRHRKCHFVLFLALCVSSGVASEPQDNGKGIPVQIGNVRNDSLVHEHVYTISKYKNVRQKLRSHLMENYDKMSHPRIDHQNKVNVGLGMALIHLEIDEIKSVMSVDAWMRIAWKDEHLAWNESDYGLDKIHFAVGEIWQPDILLYNSADDTSKGPYSNAHFLVHSDGSVLWVPSARLKAYCYINLRHWPVDSQTCNLKFGSWTSDGDQIDLELYKNKSKVELLNYYTKNQEWSISDATLYSNAMYYPCCEQKYPDITVEFKLVRNSPAYKALFILPCLAILLMTTCSFWLSPASGEKLTLNSIALLSSFMFLIHFANTLPFHSNALPLLVMLVSNTTVVVSIGIVLNVICLSLARERRFNKPPSWLKEGARSMGKFLCLGNYYHQVSSTHQRLVVELTDMAESEQQTPSTTDSDNLSSMQQSSHDSNNSMIMQDWLLVAAAIDKLCFVIYLSIFAILFLSYI